MEWWSELNTYLMASYGYGYTPYISAVSSYAPPNIVAQEVPLPVDQTVEEGYFDEAGNWVPFVFGAPEFEPGSIFAPGGIWGEAPQRGYEETGDSADDVLNDKGVDVVADWGDIFSGVVDIWQGQVPPPAAGFGAGPTGLPTVGPAAVAGPSSTMPGCAPSTPGGKYYNAALGKWCYKSPRRRRKRLLTNGDFNDLMRIATLPNNAMTKIALAKAVGR